MSQIGRDIGEKGLCKLSPLVVGLKVRRCQVDMKVSRMCSERESVHPLKCKTEICQGKMSPSVRDIHAGMSEDDVG